MKKVLVTGGMGFIGNHLVHKLLSIECEVFVVDKSIHKPIIHDVSLATIIEGDILSHELIRDLLSEVDTCFHLAALSSVGLCNRDWIFSHENNVLAFNGLLEECRHLKRPIKLVYASSSAVYGNPLSLPLCESQPTVPHSLYAADKLSNEIYAHVMYEAFGVPSIGLRLFNVYGPGQLKSNPYSGVITAFKDKIIENQAIIIFGEGSQTRDFIYIDDVVNAFLLAAATPTNTQDIVNVCSGQTLTIKALAKTMVALSHKEIPIQYAPPRTGDILHSCGDGQKAHKVLGFTPTVTLEHGLKTFIYS